MAFTLPQFNLTMNVVNSQGGALVTRLADVPCEFARAGRFFVVNSNDLPLAALVALPCHPGAACTATFFPRANSLMYAFNILVPKDTVVIPWADSQWRGYNSGDLLFLAPSGNFNHAIYVALDVADVALGWPNAHRSILAVRLSPLDFLGAL